MVAPIHVLDTIQAGIEATRGTLVPATSILDMDPGGGRLARDPSIIRIRNAGSLATSHRTYPGRDVLGVEISGPWTFNWAPWWFNLFLGPLATGTGAGADKTWGFGSAVVSDTADNLKSASFEFGGKDTQPQEYKLAGAVGSRLTLTIRQNDVWRYKAVLIGQVLTLAAKTGALSTLASIVDALGTLTKVYVNSSGSAFGTTQKVGSVVSADIDIAIGSAARWTLDGSRNPTRVAVVGPRSITAKVVAEYDAQTDYTAVHAATAQRVRVEALGPVLGAGTYKCNVDIPGVWDSFVVGDDDGVVTEELSLTAQYDATPAADINATVVNAAAALP